MTEIFVHLYRFCFNNLENAFEIIDNNNKTSTSQHRLKQFFI